MRSYCIVLALQLNKFKSKFNSKFNQYVLSYESLAGNSTTVNSSLVIK